MTGKDPRSVRDPVRRRNVADGPEEQVRQALLDWLVHTRGVPAGLIAVEKAILVNGQTRRPDIVVHDRAGAPWMVIECKAPDVVVNAAVAEQVAAYNSVLRAPYLLVSNGRDHIGAAVDTVEGRVRFLDEIPNYPAR